MPLYNPTIGLPVTQLRLRTLLSSKLTNNTSGNHGRSIMHLVMSCHQL